MINKITGLFFILITALCLVSCDEDEQRTTELLCANTWVDKYDYFDDKFNATVYATQELKFNEDGYGTDNQYFDYFDEEDLLIRTEIVERPFAWKREGGFGNVILYLSYFDGGVQRFRYVEVSEYFLKVVFDNGDEVKFTASGK